MTSNADETDFRLPRDVGPTRYELTIAPDLRRRLSRPRADRARGESHRPSSIVCNAAELEISNATLSFARRLIGAVRVSASPSTTSANASVSSRLDERPPRSCVLECEFAGVLNDKLRGFYRSTFRDEDGVEHVIATTQFESTDARRAFPCWDEPDRKAVFSITLEVDAGLLAISNARRAAPRRSSPDGKRRVSFADTIPMSTYLVAFVVGPLEATEPVDVDGIPLRVVHAPGKAGLTAFAARGRRRTRCASSPSTSTSPTPATSSTSSPSPTSPSARWRTSAASPSARSTLLADPDHSARARARERSRRSSSTRSPTCGSATS